MSSNIFVSCDDTRIFLEQSSKIILNLLRVSLNRGQAEKEFKVEVEAIGKVKHKNLVSLLGYCAEGVQRYLSPFGLISRTIYRTSFSTYF